MDQGLAYLGMKYGDDAVNEYLGKFARLFYAPLIKNAGERGLPEIRKHISETYAAEEVPENVVFHEIENELKVTITACPAVLHMRNVGYEPSKWYIKTTSIINKAIACEAGFGFEMLSYDEKTGAAEYRFFKEAQL